MQPVRPGLVVALVAGAAGCGSSVPPRECTDDDTCLRSGVMGRCLPSPISDAMWCAFMDAACETGFRWGFRAGDGLVDECVVALEPDASETVTLTVTLEGNGSGTVTSDLNGLACPGTCTVEVSRGSTVALTAAAGGGSSFVDWGGDCTGNGECVVILETDKTVIGAFGLQGEVLWRTHIRGVGRETLSDVAVHSTDRVIVVGSFDRQVTIGDRTFAPATDGIADTYVAAVDVATGTIEWAKRFGGSESDIPAGVAVDANGDIYVAGSFSGTVAFDAYSLTGASDAFLVKLNGADGSTLWAEHFDGGAIEGASALTLDASGSPIIAMQFRGVTMTVGAFTLTSNDGLEYDFALAMIDPSSGVPVWATDPIGDAGTETILRLAADSGGGVVASGSFSGPTDFRDGVLRAPMGQSDVFVARYDVATGECTWVQAFGDGLTDVGTSVSTSGAGSILLSGYFAGTIDFGDSAGSHDSVDGSTDMFIAALSVAGAPLWSRTNGGSLEDRAFGTALDAEDNVISVGKFAGAVDFGGDVLSSAAGSDDGFVVSHTTSGTRRWSTRVGGTGTDEMTRLVRAGGRLVVGGTFEGIADVAGQNVTALGESDVILTSIVP